MQDKSYKNSLAKYVHEYMFWKKQVETRGGLPKYAYEDFFTTVFGVDKDFYTGKKLLDVGCGPCGSLEWADNASRRVGLDPLAEAYQFLNNGEHKMEYTPDFVESISFPDGYFDVVVSINSLDHVDDLPGAIAEIKRVVAPGGNLFIAVEVCKFKKPCEPSPVGWDLADHFRDQFRIDDESHYAFVSSVTTSILQNKPYDHAGPQADQGGLRLKMTKTA